MITQIIDFFLGLTVLGQSIVLGILFLISVAILDLTYFIIKLAFIIIYDILNKIISAITNQKRNK